MRRELKPYMVLFPLLIYTLHVSDPEPELLRVQGALRDPS